MGVVVGAMGVEGRSVKPGSGVRVELAGRVVRVAVGEDAGVMAEGVADGEAQEESRRKRKRER